MHAVTRHEPVEQVPDALAGAHATPQSPQLEFVRMFVSHPGAAVQSSQPALHVSTVHTAPPVHSGAAFGRLQLAPHAPQLLVVSVRVSHPLAELLSQLPQPGAQPVMMHTPEELHWPVPLVGLHGELQPPQCVLVLVVVSHPFPGFPSQLPVPGAQAPA